MLHKDDWTGGRACATQGEGLSSAALVCFGGLNAYVQGVVEESDI